MEEKQRGEEQERPITATAIQVRPPNTQGLILTSLDDMQRFANSALYAGLFGQIKTDQERKVAIGKAVVSIQYGAEVGLGPMQSLQGVNVIQGKPSMNATMIATLVKRGGRYNYRVTKHTNQECVIQFFEHGHPVGESHYTMDDAAKQNLTSRNPNWRSMPKNMLFARALSNGARWYCPDAIGGSTYTPEEIAAIGNAPHNVAELMPYGDTVDSDGVVLVNDDSPEDDSLKMDDVLGDDDLAPFDVGEPPPKREILPERIAVERTLSSVMSTEAQQRKFHVTIKKLGWGSEYSKEWLFASAGVESTKDVPKAKMSDIISKLVELEAGGDGFSLDDGQGQETTDEREPEPPPPARKAAPRFGEGIPIEPPASKPDDYTKYIPPKMREKALQEKREREREPGEEA